LEIDTYHNDILSLITHDLKSPMTAVLGALDILSLDDLTLEEKKHTIKQARKASKSILRLVENILVMAKNEAGSLQIELCKVENLYSYLLDIKHTFKYEAKIKNIKLHFNIPKILPCVYWDIEILQYHAINNILSNAIKFTPENGTISFDAYLEKNNIIISIKDNGIGISSKESKTIFDKYETHNDKKVYKGTGLGLYNAYTFIKQHKGTISITKGIDKKGVGFKITLPIK